MFLYILIAIFSLVFLMAVHELGHFLLAKRFGVPVEEFGIGLPPRIFGIKIGQTLYSLNWLPLGAFVKLPSLEGEPEERDNSVPIWQRALILVGGVVATWLAAFVILSVVAGVWGLPYAAGPDEPAQVQVMGVLPDSPADLAGLRMGDLILGGDNDRSYSFDSSDQLVDFLNDYRGREVELRVQRGRQEISLPIRPRLAEEEPSGEGAIGVSIGGVTRRHYAWYEAPGAGLRATAVQTVAIPVVTVDVLGRMISGEKVPGARLVGPIGIVQIAGERAATGWENLLMLVAVIAIYFTIFNILPLPALDGGRLLFLGIEKIRGRAPNPVWENSINTVFFFLLIGLLIIVSISDIIDLIRNL